MDLDSRSQVIQSSGLLDPFLDQFVEGTKVGGLAILGVILNLHRVF